MNSPPYPPLFEKKRGGWFYLVGMGLTIGLTLWEGK